MIRRSILDRHTRLFLLIAIAAAAFLPWLSDSLAQAQTEEADGAQFIGRQIVDFGGLPASASPEPPGLRQAFADVNASGVVLGAQKVMVLRVYFKDYANNSRYTKAQVQGFFGQLDTLWQKTSYGKISINYQVTDLFQLPDNRSLYIDDIADGDLSNGGKFDKIIDDAIANAPAGLDWTNLEAVMVVMAETGAQFHRGQATSSCNKPMGPGGAAANVGCAIFSENPTETDLQVWGRWAHEIGHAFQQGGPAHPSEYNSEFELMDSNYPGQTGIFEKQSNMGFPGWLPVAKYKEVTKAKGGESLCIWAREYDPAGKPNLQAVKAKITDDLYYLISVARRVNGDELNGDFQGGAAGTKGIPDQGVLIERVSEGAAQWVVVKGKGGDRDKLWKQGDTYDGGADGIVINISKKVDDDNYCVRVQYNAKANQPDVMLERWTQPPGNSYETTDIWVDSPVNGYGTYRYGQWNDLSGNLVPIGNGDDPAIGQINRLYARVRNVGTSPATNVVVNWEITNPPGVGISGSNGWAAVGSANKVGFPGLASIAAGAFVDVYVNWTPDFAVSPADLAAGTFAFHTCVRVKLNAVAGELVLGNQDGDGEQENISYFQAVPVAGATLPYDKFIRLRNDSLVDKKFFQLSYKSNLPAAWTLAVNGGKTGVELLPGEVKDIPIFIQPKGPAVVGSTFAVDVQASSLRLLINDKKPLDKHPEFKPLGGVHVEARVLIKATLTCEAKREGSRVSVTGKLTSPDFAKYFKKKNPPKVMMVGVSKTGKFIPANSSVVVVAANGSFKGAFPIGAKDPSAQAACLFAGTTELSSASSGFIPIK